MPCETVKLSDGTLALAKRICSVCNGDASLLCDYPREAAGWASKTCDKPLCTKCAVRDGKRDLYPDHPCEQGALAL